MPGFNIPNFSFGGCDTEISSEIQDSQLPNNLETARSYRFRLRILIASTFENIVETPSESLENRRYFELACESIDRPSPKALTERVWNYANYINVPLRQEYEPINVTFYELLVGDNPGTVVNTTAKQVFGWWTNTVFDIYNLRTHYPNTRKSTVLIEQLDGLGNAVWNYKLFNCYPITLIPDTLNHNNNNISKLQILLNYDACVQL